MTYDAFFCVFILNLMIVYLMPRRGSPVDCRPSTAETPQVGKIHPFSKIAVTSKPVMQFGCP